MTQIQLPVTIIRTKYAETYQIETINLDDCYLSLTGSYYVEQIYLPDRPVVDWVENRFFYGGFESRYAGQYPIGYSN